MDAIEALKTRRSVRSFKTEPIAKEIIEDIIDCARLAATARNEQPWEFIAVTESETRKALGRTAEYGPFIKDSPLCIVVLCLDSKYYLEDGCAATQNILVATRAHGLGSCWVAGDKKEYAGKVLEILNVPNKYKLISLIAIGYHDKMPKVKKRALSEVLHWEKF